MGRRALRALILGTVTLAGSALAGSTPWAPSAQASPSAVVGTVEIPGTPTSVAVSPSGALVYVANGRSVLAVDATTLGVAWTRSVGSAGLDLAVPATGSVIYVGGGKQVVAIDAGTGEVIRTIAIKAGVDSLAVSGDGRSLWAMAHEPKGSRSGLISVVDAATGRTTGTIKVGPNPIDIQLSPSGARAYVLGWGSNEVWVINAKSRTVMSEIKVRSWPMAMALNPSGSRLLVSHSPPGPQSSYPITTINTERRAVTGVFRFAEDLDALAITPDAITMGDTYLGAGEAMVGLSTSTRSLDYRPGMVLINLRTQQAVSTMQVNAQCTGLTNELGLALAPDAQRAYVIADCTRSPGALTVIDLTASS